MRAGSATAARKALLNLVAAHPGDPRGGGSRCWIWRAWLSRRGIRRKHAAT